MDHGIWPKADGAHLCARRCLSLPVQWANRIERLTHICAHEWHLQLRLNWRGEFAHASSRMLVIMRSSLAMTHQHHMCRVCLILVISLLHCWPARRHPRACHHPKYDGDLIVSPPDPSSPNTPTPRRAHASTYMLICRHTPSRPTPVGKLNTALLLCVNRSLMW